MPKPKNPPQNAVGTSHGVLRNQIGTLKGRFGTVGGPASRNARSPIPGEANREMAVIGSFIVTKLHHGCLRDLGSRKSGPLFQMSTNAIRLRLQRLDLPSAQAWRRGWAVQALRTGVSESSVKAAAGCSSGAMVARYIRALSG